MSPAGAWLVAALALALAELVAPGVFLVFIAVAAAITGLMLLALPDLPLVGQLAAFAAWSAVAVAVGRRWYADHQVPTDDPLLNDRPARLLGEVVTITAAIEGGQGRVRVGDGAWPARGPDTPVGARVRIVAVDGATLIVEPVAPPD